MLIDKLSISSCGLVHNALQRFWGPTGHLRWSRLISYPTLYFRNSGNSTNAFSSTKTAVNEWYCDLTPIDLLLS